MDDAFRKVAALGLPGVMLVIAMATTGFAGAAAITTALAVLGGPFGMLGGIGILGITALVADSLAKVGIEGFLRGIYCERRKAESRERLVREIQGLPISDDLKRLLKDVVGSGCGC
uniref:hypothetical protein n=1 Tax=Trichocoleus desertorum TaxID=1481672 RepID=UPI0025B3E54E|nr:hypothetical protein [Trichocoleus desertorum]